MPSTNIMSELGQSDDDDDREDVWTLSMTVTYGRRQIDVIGALADYGAESLQTDRRGVMVIPAGDFLKTSEFSNAQAMRDNAVLLRCEKKGTRRHQDILTQVRAAAKAGACIALVAKPEDSVLIPRLVVAADQPDISIPVVAVPSSFKDLVGSVYHGEGETLYLHCTGPRQSMPMREYTQRARATLVDTSPKDSVFK